MEWQKISPEHVNDIYARIQVWVGGGGQQQGTSKNDVHTLHFVYALRKIVLFVLQKVDGMSREHWRLEIDGNEPEKESKNGREKKDMNCSKANRPWGGECLMSSYVHSLWLFIFREC